MSDTNSTLAREVDRHLKAARKAIDEWKEHGVRGVDPAEGQRMISAEIALLESMAVAHPRHATKLRRVSERFRKLRQTP